MKFNSKTFIIATFLGSTRATERTFWNTTDPVFQTEGTTWYKVEEVDVEPSDLKEI